MEQKRGELQEEQYSFPYHYLDLITKQYQVWLLESIEKRKIVKKLIGSLKFQKLMDAGCGDGRFCYDIKNYSKNIVGIDYSSKALRFAKAFNPNIKFILKDLANISFKEEFDVIVCIETLEHIPHEKLKKVIKNFYRALKPKGKLIITVPSTNVKVERKHYQHFNDSKIRNLLSNEFSIKKIFGFHKLGIENIFFKILKYFSFFTFLSNKIFFMYLDFLRKIYRKRLMICEPKKAQYLIVVCEKTK